MSPLEDLLIDRETQIENLVKKATGVVGIDRETGGTSILVSTSELLGRHLIGLHLIGRFFASEMGKAESPVMSTKELSEKTGKDYHSVGARLSELKREGIVRSRSRGEWEIVLLRMGALLDEVRAKLKL